MNVTTTQNVRTTKHVLSTAVETHVSYQIFVDKGPFVKLQLIDLYVDVLKDGEVFLRLNVSNVSNSTSNAPYLFEIYTFLLALSRNWKLRTYFLF